MSTVTPEDIFIPPTRGVIPNRDPFEYAQDALRDSANWLFDQQGHFVVRPGFTQFGTTITGERPLGFVQYRDVDGERKTVAGTNRGWHKYDETGGTFVDITGTALTGNDEDQCIFRVFQKGGATFLLGVNGKDTPKAWSGVGSYVEMGGSPPVAKCMAINNDHVLLGNLKSGGTVSPVAVDVSATQNFDAGWGTTLVALLADTPGALISMLEIGNQQTALYKEDAIYLAIAQGIPGAPFRFELRVPGVRGPGSPRCVVVGEEQGVHYLLATDLAVYLFDGTRPLSLGRNIQSYIATHASRAHLKYAHGTFDAEQKKLYYFFIGTDAGTVWRGVCIDLERAVSGQYSLFPIRFQPSREITSAHYITRGTAQTTIVGTGAGKVLENTGADDDGENIFTLLEPGLTPWTRFYRTLKDIEHGFLQTLSSQIINILIGRTNHAEIRTFGESLVSIDSLLGDIDSLVGDIDSLASSAHISQLDLGNAPPFKTEHRQTARAFSLRYEANVNVAGVRWRGTSWTLHQRGLR